MTDTPYFVIDDLTIGYHKVPVIRDISVKVQKGEIIALIGPNGAGKSTLLKTIARDLEPIRGKIFLEGRDMQTITYRELSKKLAVILTERIKVELTTCRDVVATGRYPYTGRLGVLRGEDQRIVDEAMETVHALELAERDFNAISDGQRQRVLLARAIAQQPEMILLDEPTSFLDVRHKLDLLTILTRMARKKNITVIMSLHEIDLAEKVADRILTVKGDTQFGFGAPGEVFEEQAIRKLYDIEDGYFDPLFGSIELKKPAGDTPEVFVLAGAGTGISVYRKLQRENVPFATGVLYENDVDYRLARLLAAETVSVPAFAAPDDAVYEKAFETMRRCGKDPPRRRCCPDAERAAPRAREGRGARGTRRENGRMDAVKEKKGMFYAVGVGPGDPMWMTREACAVLEACPVIAAPQTASGEMLALSIAQGAAELGGKTILPLSFAMSRDAAVRAEGYARAADAIAPELDAGRDVAMVNLGDVSIYATAYYVLDELRRRGYDTRMVPGVASFSAVAAALGRSLTEMELPLHIYPAGASDLDAALAQPGTKVLMKSGKAIGETAAALSRHGLAEESAMVADCGLPTQQVFETITGLPEKISYFATVIVPDSKE